MSQTPYEMEQARLRQEYDTGETEDDIHIEVAKEPEVNPEVFRDVEPILFRGFLCVTAEINEVPFVFKSLNHHEFERLHLIGGLQNTPKSVQRFYNTFLAYGVLMVDGHNVLADRQRWIPELSDMFASLPEAARKQVIRYLSDVNRRASRAVTLTEAYAMESQSRLRWAQYNGLDLSSPAVTGFDGTPSLGLNWGQLMWRALNHFEDLKEKAEREWENAKFVASAMAGKGISKIYSQDRDRRKKEREERLERRDRILRFALLGESLEGPSKGYAQMKVARTVEELEDQLRKDLKGEKDWHDMVVEDYERQIREQYEQRMSHVRGMQQAFVEQHGDRQIVSRTRMEGLTKEEVERLVEERRQRSADRLATLAEYPEIHDPKAEGLMTKWLPVKKGSDNG